MGPSALAGKAGKRMLAFAGDLLTRRMREDIENFSRIIRELGLKAE